MAAPSTKDACLTYYLYFSFYPKKHGGKCKAALFSHLSLLLLFRSISPTSYSNCICNGFLYTYVLVSWREHAYTVASLAHSVGMFWNVLGLIPFPRTVFGDDLWILLGLNLLRRHPKPNLIAHYEKNSSRSWLTVNFLVLHGKSSWIQSSTSFPCGNCPLGTLHLYTSCISHTWELQGTMQRHAPRARFTL